MQISKQIHTIDYLQKKAITFHDVITFIKSVSNKDKNNYYYNIFLEKASNELPKR